MVHSNKCSLTSLFPQNSLEGGANLIRISGITGFLYSCQDFLQSFLFSSIDNEQSFSVDFSDSDDKKKVGILNITKVIDNRVHSERNINFITLEDLKSTNTVGIKV